MSEELRAVVVDVLISGGLVLGFLGLGVAFAALVSRRVDAVGNRKRKPSLARFSILVEPPSRVEVEPGTGGRDGWGRGST